MWGQSDPHLIPILFSEDPSSEPEEDAKGPDLEADGQPDGVADREEDRDDFEDDVEDDLDDEVEDNGDDKDYDPVGDASADLSSLDKEEEGQDHGCTTTPTGLVERETFNSVTSPGFVVVEFCIRDSVEPSAQMLVEVLLQDIASSDGKFGSFYRVGSLNLVQ
ncbi:unnamed protein product [Pleuronectes platessa]|uniref:Uncharacterized protein n=1 Tax=Pleuronectes platessa TaxID=8262 RepID=A0A9N7UJL7_PLEPL|nr:unnamed protein product [Pleuronectes platessa]